MPISFAFDATEFPNFVIFSALAEAVNFNASSRVVENKKTSLLPPVFPAV
jgi:hypothetical protein